MTKQELIQAVKEIQTICNNAGKKGTWEDCKTCLFYGGDDKCIFIDDEGQDAYPPCDWDIQRWERESDE